MGMVDGGEEGIRGEHRAAVNKRRTPAFLGIDELAENLRAVTPVKISTPTTQAIRGRHPKSAARESMNETHRPNYFCQVRFL